MDVDKLIKKKQRAKRDGNLQQMVEIVKDLGDLYFETGRMEDALQEYLEQLEVCNVLADKLNIAIAHRMIGEVYTALGDYEQAFIHQNLYLEGAQETNNLLEEQRAYATLGRTHFCHAESLAENSAKKTEALSCAKKVYTKSIYLCKELENTGIEWKELLTMRARLLLNLGLVLEAQEDHQQAIDLIEKAAILCKDEDLRDDLHRTQIALASIYERQFDFTRSLEHLDNAINIENTCLKAEAQLAKAELLIKMEKWQESRKILVSLYVSQGLNKSLKNRVDKFLRIVATLQETERVLETEINTDMKLKYYEKLGDAAAAAGCFEKAIDYYRQMLHCAEESDSTRIGAALISLAQTLKDTGQYTEALPFARRELELNAEPREISRSALFLVDLLIESNAADDEIRETYELALNNAKLDDSMLRIVAKEFSNYLEQTGNTEKAAELKETINLPAGSQKSNSEEESEEEIGADICLDDLSDVEELKMGMGIKRTDRRRSKKTVVRRNEKGETQLHVACISGNIQAVEKLLATEHPVNLRDHAGWTPLHEAANHGYVEITKLLLEHGANINDPGGQMCSGVTPLHDAASCGHLSIIRLLIEHGANVVLRTATGETVLDCLKQWRNRVDLPPDEQPDYDDIVRKLSTAIPENVPKRNKNRLNVIETESESETDNEDEQRISAGEYYKRIIASLKHRESRMGALPGKKRPVVGPLLNAEEVLLDDWLEDDIGIGKGSSKEKAREKKKAVDVHNEKRKSIEKFEDRRESDDFENAAKRRKLSGSYEVNGEEMQDLCKSNKIKLKRKQISLLSAGFTRNSTSRTPSPVPSPPLLEPTEAAVRIENLFLNVYLDGTVFTVTVQFPKDGSELREKILSDVKQSLYNESGCRSQLELQTMDGGLLLPENTSIILGNGVKDLKCEILDLTVPPIMERYSAVCKTYNTEIRESISSCLKSCENTSILHTKLEEITKQEVICVLKVIQFQKNIQVLNLTGGEMDKNGELLNQCMMKLSTLQELCLTSCDISSYCLSKFERFPPCLKILDLSFNPLGKESRDKLEKLLTPLKQLQTLNLRSCMLENFQHPLNSENLIDLDISWNKLSLDAISSFLQRRLLSLNLSYTISPNVTDLIPSIMNSGFCFAGIQSVELTSCNLLDVDIETILLNAPNLVKIILSDNKELSILSAKRLLAHKPTLRNIDMVGCSIITEYPDCETFIESPENCKFLATMDKQVCQCWLALWREKGTMETFSNDTVIFKPVTRIKT